MITENKKSLGIIRLTAFSIGTTLASGAFSLSGDMASNGAYTAAVLVGWVICGVGMMALVMCFYGFSRFKPELTSGIYSYAKEGFGNYIGFNSAWGYLLSAILANVSFATLLFAALGYFFPIFDEGNNLASIICASLFLWFTVGLVLRGMGEATSINVIVIIAKIIPIVTLITAVIFVRAFDMSIFMHNFWGEGSGFSFLDQIHATTYTTAWAFVGIEGAVVISGRAKKSRDAGLAVIISFLCLLLMYVMISVLSMGVMTKEELALLGNPPLAGILESVVGSWGAAFVNIAVIISLAGATFAYTMLASEALYAPATKQCFPKYFLKENKSKAPLTAVIISNLIVQAFLISVFFNESTYQIFYGISVSMIMVPYFFSALFYLKIVLKKDKDIALLPKWDYTFQVIIAIFGTIYGAWLLYSSGINSILITALLYAPGMLIYIWAQKEKKEKVFGSIADIGAFVVILIMFVSSILLQIS